MDKPVLVIANSKAGSAHQKLDQLVEALDTYEVDYVLHKVSTPPEAESIIDSVPKGKFSSVVSLGGDGTAAVIIKAATRKKLPVLPLRGGTGNGLARSIGVSDNVEANVQAFSSGSYVLKKFPLASVNGEALVLDFHFGMLAESVLSTPAGIKKWIGDKAYILNTIKKGTTDTKDSYHMKIDGEDIKIDAYACYIANITTMPFQGVNIFPEPKPGFVRVVTLNSRNPVKLAWWFFVKRLTGRTSNKAIIRWYAKKVEFYKTPRKMIFDDHERKVNLPLIVEAESTHAELLLPIIKEQGWGAFRSSLKTEYYRQTDHLQRIISGVQSERFSKVSSHLYLGGSYGSKAIRSFAVRGVTGVVSMRERKPQAIAESANIEILHLPTRDHTSPTLESLERGVVFIRKHIESGGSVYVHCRMGEGRGPTMAAAYMISSGMSTEQALTHLRHYRPFVRPNKMQVRTLKEFEAKIRK